MRKQNRTQKMDSKKTASEKFEEQVIRQDGCWGWKGGTNGKYGKILTKHGWLAHRLSWILHFGEIPKSMCVLHTCDNTICTNPNHLFLGTVKDNTQDMLQKNRNNPPRGEKNGNCRLKESQALEIIQLIKNKNRLKDIAIKYGVSETHISKIKNKRKWAYLWDTISQQ